MQNKLLQLGHSPDPDDAFMFYALAQDPPLIETRGYRFQHVLQDIQTLNQRARRGELEITAISIHAYPYVSDKYALTSCGSSMGDKYGPMVVSMDPMTDAHGYVQLDRLKGKTIAIPGKLTTAFLALQLCLGRGVEVGDAAQGSGGRAQPLSASTQAGAGDPSHDEAWRDQAGTHDGEPVAPAFRYVVVPFDQILQYVKDGKADAGLIIHEGQLTYKQMGLNLIVDLGVWWYERTKLPLPLGGNCIRRDLGAQVMQDVTDVLKASIQYSLDHREKAVEYALQFGRDLDKPLADRFVGMYVNKWTLDYGPRGREAITRLLKEGAQAGLVPDVGEIDYVTAR